MDFLNDSVSPLPPPLKGLTSDLLNNRVSSVKASKPRNGINYTPSNLGQQLQTVCYINIVFIYYS